MDQDKTRGDSSEETAVREAGGDAGVERAHEDDCADPIAKHRPPGVPPGGTDDVEGYDESVAESFPASDPPANY